MAISETELSAVISDHNGCTRITCRVQPRSSRCRIAGILDGSLKIALTAPPVDGKANAALWEFFATLLRCPKSAVSVVSGVTNKNKILEIAGVSADTVRMTICAQIR